MTHSIDSKDSLSTAVHASFVDDRILSDETLHAKFLSNDPSRNCKVLEVIKKELLSCSDFMFSVAFITDSGLITLLNSFRVLEENGIRGRLLTSTYQYFNKPAIFKKLLRHRGVVDVHIYRDSNFHAKGYIFRNGAKDKINYIVGSSNLTQEAITSNHEWNIKINSTLHGALTKEVQEEFEYLWMNSKPLSEEWISDYEIEYEKSHVFDLTSLIRLQQETSIVPNKMQREALEELKKFREKGYKKALLISATGTGKTILSALDVKVVAPKRFLFVIHRENVARSAHKSFRMILGDKISMGFLMGSEHSDYSSDYIFATIQTLSKEKNLEKFSPDHFDYIVIDEVHHAGAKTYLKIMDYFKPAFILGMTATPERMDGINIFQLFEHRIAYEIRLDEAMKYDLLTPFHYFGINDLMINGQVIDDFTNFNLLVSDLRVNHIIDKIEYYGHSGNRLRGLVFCSHVNEAIELSKSFNQRGYRSTYLDGTSSDESRRIAIDRLEQEEYENGYDLIFTRDVFNEGVDIPRVNQIIMLRPTQSAIIFVQQLGRGLRKANDKDYVVVLDFIGNYNNNWMIPVALSGDRSYSKDQLRQFIKEGNNQIFGSSTINLDPITQKQIYDSINRINFSTVKFINKEYNYLKNIVGRIPTLIDFYEHGAMEPSLIFEKFKSYHAYLKVHERQYSASMKPTEEHLLHYFTRDFSNGKRIHEILIIESLLTSETVTIENLRERLMNEYGLSNQDDSISSALRLLNGSFQTSQENIAVGSTTFVNNENSTIKRSVDLRCALASNDFRSSLIDLIAYSKRKYLNEYSEHIDSTGFILNKKYSRKDVCRILNWEDNEASTINGYRIKYNTCPIFVTYNKSDHSIKYSDYFVTRHQFHWMTRNNRTLESKESLAIRNQMETDLKIQLFVKKSDDEGKDHYYLGKMQFISMVEETIATPGGPEKAVPIGKVVFKLMTPLRDDIFDYLTIND
jgi:superfamily II DNA or RNA helicase